MEVFKRSFPFPTSPAAALLQREPGQPSGEYRSRSSPPPGTTAGNGNLPAGRRRSPTTSRPPGGEAPAGPAVAPAERAAVRRRPLVTALSPVAAGHDRGCR